MFMTFKTAGPSSVSDGSMRRVTAASAKLGTARRAACVNCQRKKIRCTGDLRTCDNCKEHQIQCINSRNARAKKVSARTATGAQSTITGLSPTSPDPSSLVLSRPTCTRWKSLHSISPAEIPPDPIQEFSNANAAAALYFPEDFSIDNISTSTTPSSITDTPQVEGCKCNEGLLHVLQRLDDDEFKLKTLAFDQILKLQKWLIFQCLIPLECNRCGQTPMSHTTVLIVCERVVNITQCLSKRLSRLWRNLASYSIDHGLEVFEVLQLPEIQVGTDPTPLSVDKIDEESWHLYDGDTGEAGITSKCTLHLFSPEFRAEYSSDEQCGMIQVLAKKQIDNAMRLLERLRVLCGSSAARTGKVLALEQRLKAASDVTRESLESISQAFEI